MAINRKRQWRLMGDGSGYHIPAPGIEAGTATTEGRGATAREPADEVGAPGNQDQASHEDPVSQPSPVDGANSGGEAAGSVIPEGWVLVPREPTEVMLDAGEEARREHTDVYFDGSEVARDIVPQVYAAMLSASPRPSYQEKRDA